jgi:hypothetical protein
VKSIYAHFEMDTHFLGWLTKLYQIGIVEDFIMDFKKLAIWVEGITSSYFK